MIYFLNLSKSNIVVLIIIGPLLKLKTKFTQNSMYGSIEQIKLWHNRLIKLPSSVIFLINYQSSLRFR